MMEDLPTAGVPEEEQVDDDDSKEPAFVGPNEAVEVQVDEDAPMEEDDDTVAAEADATQSNQEDSKPSGPDMSRVQLASHTGPVYGVHAHFDAVSETLTLVTGGGDDRAFLHHIRPAGIPPATVSLEHAHTDSVSAVALNLPHVSDDLTQTPKLAVVGGYDGGR